MTINEISTAGNGLNSSKVLGLSAKMWFIITTAGLWFFGFYLIGVYYTSAFHGNFGKWNNILPNNHVGQGWKGKIGIVVHIFLAAVLVIGGPMQLMPFIRRKYKRFHRTLGKIYIISAILTAAAGVIMVWTRRHLKEIGSVDMDIFNTIQAAYIISFGIIAITYARKRDFTKHRAWAMRLFMVTNGVWFFRVCYHAWRSITKGYVGFNPETFTGPFPSLLSLFIYTIPVSLIMLELYFAAQRSRRRNFKLLVAALIFLFTIIMILGIYRGVMKSWLPRLGF